MASANGSLNGSGREKKLVSFAIGLALLLSPSQMLPARAASADNGAEASETKAEDAGNAGATAKSKKKKSKGGWDGNWPKKNGKDNGQKPEQDKSADLANDAAKSTEADKGPKASREEEKVNEENGEEGKLSQEDAKDRDHELSGKNKVEKVEKDSAKKEKDKDKSKDPTRPFEPEAVKEYNQGVELQQQGFLNQAIQKYKSALVIDDRIERAHCNLGLIYIAQRNFSKASEAFKKALVLKPNNPFSLNGMGSVFYSKGKLADAMERWQKAVESDPNFFSAYFNMANAWKNEKDLDKALENYVMTIKTNPNMADAYYETGLILSKLKHPAQAHSMLAKAMLISPEGDFVSEAKKQLQSIENSLGSDQETEVKMNVMAPPINEENNGQGNN